MHTSLSDSPLSGTKRLLKQPESPSLPPPPRRTIGGRRLPEQSSALLHHLQEQTLRASSDRAAQRLVRFFRCISPRLTDDVEEPEALGIDLNVVRPLCGEGIPDDVPALRAALWKVMLGYLPTDLFQWDAVLHASRAAYAGFVHELQEQLSPTTEQDCGNVGDCEEDGEHRWCRGALNGVFGQIAKDIVRTRSELDFFGRRIDGILEPGCCSGRDPETIDVIHPLFHHDVLARVLLLFAQFNPGVLYVQGMNELAAPLYYAFSRDPLAGRDAEADTFFCFTLLMADMRDAFVKSLDDTDNGMLGRIDRYSELLREKDAQVWKHLEAKRVSPVYYTVRWLTLMLAQEHEMPDVLRLWDSLLSDFARPHPLLLYMCVAMVIHVREELLASDFTDCMRVLQRYPPVLVDELLQTALQLRASDLAPAGASSADVVSPGRWWRTKKK